MESQIINDKLTALIVTMFGSDDFKVEVFQSPLYGYKAVVSSTDDKLTGIIIGKGGVNARLLRQVFNFICRTQRINVELFINPGKKYGN